MKKNEIHEAKNIRFVKHNYLKKIRFISNYPHVMKYNYLILF